MTIYSQCWEVSNMFDFYGMQFVFAYVRTSSEVLEKWMEKGSKIRSALHQFSFGMGVIVCVCVFWSKWFYYSYSSVGKVSHVWYMIHLIVTHGRFFLCRFIKSERCRWPVDHHSICQSLVRRILHRAVEDVIALWHKQGCKCGLKERSISKNWRPVLQLSK